MLVFIQKHAASNCESGKSEDGAKIDNLKNDLERVRAERDRFSMIISDLEQKGRDQTKCSDEVAIVKVDKAECLAKNSFLKISNANCEKTVRDFRLRMDSLTAKNAALVSAKKSCLKEKGEPIF